MTQEFLQDAMVADLKELFAHERLKSSLAVSYTHLTLPTIA